MSDIPITVIYHGMSLTVLYTGSVVNVDAKSERHQQSELSTVIH